MKNTRVRSLWPREHGAYAQLAAPLLAALVLRVPSLSAGLLAIAASSCFLANEPLLVVLGHRGPRRRDVDGPRATRRLVLLVGLAAGCAAVGLWLAPPVTLAVAAAVAVPALAMFALAWRRAEHSLAGEVVAAVALPAAAAPVAVASGVAWQAAALITVGWAAGYACTVIAVHRVLARHRAAFSWRDVAAAGALAAVLVTISLVARSLPLLAAAIPLALVATVIAIRPPRAVHLRAIGVVLVIASIGSGTLAVVVAA